MLIIVILLLELFNYSINLLLSMFLNHNFYLRLIK